MESRVEQLEVDLYVAEAKADLAIRLIRYLADELSRSSISNWDSDDLFRQFLDDVDYIDPGEEIARLSIMPNPDEATMAEGVMAAEYFLRTQTRLRNEIRDRIRQERASPS